MNKAINTQQRLQERQNLLEQRASMQLDRAKGGLSYLRTDGLKILGAEVSNKLTNKVADSSPIIGKILSLVGGNSGNTKSGNTHREPIDIDRPRSSYSTRERRSEDKSSAFLSIISALLPSLYTVGGMKLLSSSLKGGGKILRTIVKRILFKKRK